MFQNMLDIEWDRYENIVLRDIPFKWYTRVIEFMKENYFRTNTLFEKLKYFEDETALKDYEAYLKHILRTECSLMAINEDFEIKAVAMLKWNSDEWRSWRATIELLPDGKLSQLLKLHKNSLIEYVEKNKEHNILESSLHVFEYFVASELRIPEFMTKFFNAIKETGRHMKMPRITFLAISNREREDLEYLEHGFTELSQTIYSLYHDAEEVPYITLRDIDEMYATLYEWPLEPLKPYYEMETLNSKYATQSIIEKRGSGTILSKSFRTSAPLQQTEI